MINSHYLYIILLKESLTFNSILEVVIKEFLSCLEKFLKQVGSSHEKELSNFVRNSFFGYVGGLPAGWLAEESGFKANSASFTLN